VWCQRIDFVREMVVSQNLSMSVVKQIYLMLMTQRIFFELVTMRQIGSS
jgi:hypothetical protein